MLRQLIFRCADKFFKLHKDYLNAKLLKSLRFCGERVSISPDARIWGTDAVTLEDDVGINAFTHIFGGGACISALGPESPLGVRLRRLPILKR